MNKRNSEPDHLKKIKERVDFYQATIEALKADHSDFQKLILENNVQANQSGGKNDMEEEHSGKLNSSLLEKLDDVLKQVDRLKVEVYTIHEKIDQITQFHQPRQERNELALLREEIAQLAGKTAAPQREQAPANRTPTGFHQMKNLMNSSRQVYQQGQGIKGQHSNQQSYYSSYHSGQTRSPHAATYVSNKSKKQVKKPPVKPDQEVQTPKQELPIQELPIQESPKQELPQVPETMLESGDVPSPNQPVTDEHFEHKVESPVPTEESSDNNVQENTKTSNSFLSIFQKKHHNE